MLTSRRGKLLRKRREEGKREKDREEEKGPENPPRLRETPF